MEPSPTPFDILDPAGPPIEVSYLYWIVAFGFFALTWISIWYYNRQNRERRQAIKVSPLIVELQTLYATFENQRSKEPLHLFIKMLRRHPELLTNEAHFLLRKIDEARFAPHLGGEVERTMKELLSIVSHQEHAAISSQKEVLA